MAWHGEGGGGQCLPSLKAERNIQIALRIPGMIYFATPGNTRASQDSNNSAISLVYHSHLAQLYPYHFLHHRVSLSIYLLLLLFSVALYLDRLSTHSPPFGPSMLLVHESPSHDTTPSQKYAYLPPEILHTIFGALGIETYVGEPGYNARLALVSSAQVNRLWASVAIPFLWKKVGFYPYKASLPRLLKGVSDAERRQEYAALVEEAAIFRLCYEDEIKDCQQMLQLVTFPRLQQLHLRNVRLDKCVPAIQAPALTCLSLDCEGVRQELASSSPPREIFARGFGRLLARMPLLKHLKIIDLDYIFTDEELVGFCHEVCPGLQVFEHVRPASWFHDLKTAVLKGKGEVVWKS